MEEFGEQLKQLSTDVAQIKMAMMKMYTMLGHLVQHETKSSENTVTMCTSLLTEIKSLHSKLPTSPPPASPSVSPPTSPPPASPPTSPPPASPPTSPPTSPLTSCSESKTPRKPPTYPTLTWVSGPPTYNPGKNGTIQLWIGDPGILTNFEIDGKLVWNDMVDIITDNTSESVSSGTVMWNRTPIFIWQLPEEDTMQTTIMIAGKVIKIASGCACVVPYSLANRIKAWSGYKATGKRILMSVSSQPYVDQHDVCHISNLEIPVSYLQPLSK